MSSRKMTTFINRDVQLGGKLMWLKVAGLDWLIKVKHLKWCNIYNKHKNFSRDRRIQISAAGSKLRFINLASAQQIKGHNVTFCWILLNVFPQWSGANSWSTFSTLGLSFTLCSSDNSERKQRWRKKLESMRDFYEGERSSKPGFNNCFPLVSRKWQMVRPPEARRWE